jgi:trimeric autotransporter adhesin
MAGSANQGDGGAATAAQFGTIKGIAVDGRGNLYIADTDHDQIRQVNAAGVVSVAAGTGTAGYSGDGGPAAAAQLNLPYGVAVDAAGYVYVADYGNSVVRRIAPDGTIRTYAGNGQAGYSGDGGQATSARILSPRNVAVDAAGNLYISEFGGHHVRKVAPNGIITTVAGTGIAGYSGDGGPATAAQLHSPAGLAIDRYGALYIADSGNGCVRVVQNGVISTRGNYLAGMVGVAVGADQTLYSALAGPAVWELNAAAGSQWYVAAGGNGAGFSGDGGSPLEAKLSAASDLALTAQSNLFVADGARVREIANLLTEPIIQTVAGDDYLTSVGDGGPATSAILENPAGLALDASGNLYIADSGNNRVRRVNSAGVIQTIAGTGTGYTGQDGVAATQSNVWAPMGVALGPAGNLFLADTGNHRIRVVNAGGVIFSFAGTGLTPYNGQASGAPPSLQADGLPALQVNLWAPRDVCVDRSGAVFIVDTNNNRVLRAAANGATTQTAAGNGSAGDFGDGGAAPLAQLNQPGACALDTAGNLYLADTLSHRIRKVTPAGVISTVAGTGIAGFSGDGGPATAAQLNAPAGVAVEDDGNLFISDTNNQRVRQVTPDGTIQTIAGQGTAGFSGDGGDAPSAQLSTPAGLALDGAGDVYIADSGNHRVRRLVPGPPAAQTTVPSAPAPAISAVNAASQVQGPVAPGEIVTIFGQGMGPSAGVQAAYGASGLLPTSLGGAEVHFDGLPAPLLYAQYGQINAQVPYAVAGNVSTHIEVFYQSQLVGTVDLSITAANPALFPVALNQDGSVNSQSNPAPRGTALIFFATGEGLTTGANISGMAEEPPYAQPKMAVVMTMGGISCTLLYAGSAPAQAGELQVNAIVPGGFLPSGPAAAQLLVGNSAAPPFTVWVQ